MSKKPRTMSWESWIDRRIREAQERGEFENVPKGPIKDLDKPYDANWWLKDWMERENLSLSPEAVELRVRVQKKLKEILKFTSEQIIRDEIQKMNSEIRQMNARDIGPLQPQKILDEDEIVSQWKKSN